MKNKLYIGFTVIIAAVLLVVFMRPSSKKDTEMLDELKGRAEERRSFVRVRTVELARSPLVMHISTTGTARAERIVDIMPQSSGFVKKINVKENSYVRKGDILFTIDNEQYDLNYQSARDNLLKAKIEYGMRRDQVSKPSQKTGREELDKSISELEKKMAVGVINRQQFDDMRLELEIEYLFSKNGSNEVLRSSTGLTQAMINYRKSALDLENTVVKSRISGYVSDIKISEGQYVGSGTKCFAIVDHSDVIMDIPVLESEISQLSAGRKVQVVFEAMKDTVFTGVIEALSPVIDRTTGTGTAMVRISNKDLLIKSGMSGNVNIEGRIYEDRILVPNEAVLTRDNRKLIFTAEDGKAKWIYVTTGLSNHYYTELILDPSSNLKLGDRIIVTNNYTLSHDADIIVEDA